MNPLKRIFILLVTLITFFSCNSEIKPISFETTVIEMPSEADISISIDEAIGKSELSKTINFQIEEAIISTLSEASKKTNLNSVLADFNKEYVDFKTDFPESSDPRWELFVETEKIYQSEAIITIAISTYEFQGGAHGNDKIVLLNLDAKTGKVLNHNEIININDKFNSIAEKHFKNSLAQSDSQSTIQDYFFGKSFQLPENMGFSEDGLILLYNTYEIASYAQGYTEFVIPFEEIDDLIKVD